MKVGGKRFPRRGNRRRPPKAACGAPLSAELLPPHRAALYRRAWIPHIRRYEACFGEHSIRILGLFYGKFDSKYNAERAFRLLWKLGGDQAARLCTCAGSPKRHLGVPLGAVRRRGDSRMSARSVLLRLYRKGRHRRPASAGGGARTSERKRAWCRHSAFRSDQRFP